jgi:hypothetical protein
MPAQKTIPAIEIIIEKHSPNFALRTRRRYRSAARV